MIDRGRKRPQTMVDLVAAVLLWATALFLATGIVHLLLSSFRGASGGGA